MFLKRMPLKCKIMAEKQDIRENTMSGGTPARLRGLAANGNSISPTLEEVENAFPKMSCIYHKVWTASKGDILVVNSSYSIFMVGDSASGSHIMGVFANNITVLSKQGAFSEVKDQEGAVNIYRQDEHNIVIQNNSNNKIIRILFLSSY